MFGKTKYIVIERFDMEEIVIFNETQNHSDVAKAFRQEPISAGFLTVSATMQEARNGSGSPFIAEPTGIPVVAEPTVHAWGHSESLKLESRPEADTKLAQQALGVAKELL